MRCYYLFFRAALLSFVCASIFTLVGVLSIGYEKLILAKIAFIFVCLSVFIGFMVIIAGWLNLPTNFVSNGFKCAAEMRRKVMGALKINRDCR